jgi:hypothetical protein
LKNPVAKFLHKSNVAKVEESKKQKLLEEALDDETVDDIEEGVYYPIYIDEWSEFK